MDRRRILFMFVFLLVGVLTINELQKNRYRLDVFAQETDQETSQLIEASSASVPQGTHVQLTLYATPPGLNPEQLKAQEEKTLRGPLAMPPIPIGDTAVARPESIPDQASQTAPPAPELAVQVPESLNAPGDYRLYRHTNATSLKSQTAYVTEPTVANSGPIVFMTGNWFAAISGDGGKTFAYVNPYTMFPNSYGGFCCDQITVYDPSRDIFLWYLQYNSSGAPGTGKNIFRLAVARPENALKGSWWYYDFVSDTNTEWDYPDMCISNDYVWITTNRGPFGGSYVNDAWMFKFPLDPLSTGVGFGYSFVDLGSASITNLSLHCTRGARETMFFGTHNTTSQIRIFNWPENSGSVGWNDVNLSAAWFNSVHTCPGPDGHDWCGFDDGRIKAGWVSQGRIGFMWGSSQGGGFSYPYIEAVRVRESDRSLLDRPLIWSNSGAFAYPSAHPNARGDLGIAFFFGGNAWYPYFGVGIDDDYSRDLGLGWEIHYIRQSSQGPNYNRWGDYISVQPFAPNGLGWVAAGFSLQGCGAFSGCSEPSYSIFGRERDLRSVSLYYDPKLCTFLPVVLH
jgi:hypothetical protein